MPTIAEFQEGRKNKDAYSFFCYFFLRRTIGHASFKDYFAGENASISALFTESDEAFVLVILETSAEFWTAHAEDLRKKGGTKNIQGDGAAKRRNKKDNGDGEDTEKATFVKRYNVLQKQMRAEREQKELCNEFDKHFREYLYKTSGGLFGVPKMDENVAARANKKEEEEEEEVEIVFRGKNATAV